MTNMARTAEQPCDTQSGSDEVRRVITPRETELGGFVVRRSIPTREQRSLGPWIFIDHMGPADFQPGHGVNVPPHPHIGLATVTYLFDGQILHRDSLGSELVITPGAINLMVAGSGIVHSEREPAELTEQAHSMHGLQLWLALPDADEQCAPEFHHYSADELPSDEGIKVLIGEVNGLRSPVKTFSPTLFSEARLSAGDSIQLPEYDEVGVYLLSGSASVGTQQVQPNQLVVLSRSGLSLQCSDDCHLVMLGGSSVGKRYLDWNFAASSTERLKQAREDWKAGRFAKVPGDEDDFVPYPGSD
ncbi:hypothetical protein CWE12_12930 [Aliidiomarina sedimenti]|uniref:Pirin family protein n=1 Tax=Aliidiomarina sedimenti TaxID=1933879 RepID=A0ABY0BVH7_9GAMM|nr:pirin family protein [Aliidiomarina sedimenti]RUO28119.1 hypothetical protein CWE12_12930 [Aliidiomarina sedimenti]